MIPFLASSIFLSSVQFSCSHLTLCDPTDSKQHARPPCPSPTPRACSNSCSSSQWCHPTISCCHSLLPPSIFPSIKVLSRLVSVLLVPSKSVWIGEETPLFPKPVDLGQRRLWSEVKVTQSCLTLCDPMNYMVHGLLQAWILEWVAFSFSRGSSQPRDRTQVSCITGGFFTSWTTREILCQGRFHNCLGINKA